MGPLSVALVYNFLIIYQHFEIIRTTTCCNNTQPATVHLIHQFYHHLPSFPHVLQPVFSRRGASAPLPLCPRPSVLRGWGGRKSPFLVWLQHGVRGDGDCVLYFYTLTTFHAKLCETFPVWAQNRLISGSMLHFE